MKQITVRGILAVVLAIGAMVALAMNLNGGEFFAGLLGTIAGYYFGKTDSTVIRPGASALSIIWPVIAFSGIISFMMMRG